MFGKFLPPHVRLEQILQLHLKIEAFFSLWQVCKNIHSLIVHCPLPMCHILNWAQSMYRQIGQKDSDKWTNNRTVTNVTLVGCICTQGFPGGSRVKNSPAKAGDMGSVPGSGSSPKGGNAWEIPGTEEPGRLQSMGSQRVGCDTEWLTLSLSFILMSPWGKNS